MTGALTTENTATSKMLQSKTRAWKGSKPHGVQEHAVDKASKPHAVQKVKHRKVSSPQS